MFRVFCWIPALTVFLSGVGSAWAADIVTQSGKLLKNAVIVAADVAEVTVRYDGGTEKFSVTEIPSHVLKKYRDEELRRKEEEVEKLKQDLARQQQELQQLKTDNERLRREQKNTVPRPAPPAPSKPLADVQAVGPTDVIDVQDLVLYYEADRAGADQRFLKKDFRIRGVVAGFSPKLFIRWYDVGLESPSKSINVVCKFGYRDEWQSVYTTERGRKLIAKVPRAELTLLKVGQTVTIQCRCEGFRDGEIEFNKCEPVR